MRKFDITCIFLILSLAGCRSGKSDTSQNTKADYPITPVEFTRVHISDAFWMPRLDINKKVTIPYSFIKCEESGRIENFKVAGGINKGKFRGIFPFDDSDVYKIIEGASYSLTTNPDPVLEKYIDTLISYIAAAQEEDGYLQTWRTIDPASPPNTWSGNEERWSNIGSGHELYNMGHFYEAAVAHFQATGKRTLLDLALKNADLIVATFGTDKIVNVPGHQEIELGLIKLYRVTGKKEYLNLAHFFLDMRGREDKREKLNGKYSQDHIPVTDQSEAVGHAVRAGYMYSAMADIAAMTNDTAYLSALEKIWDNVTGYKQYITGGVGARHEGESFGANYELPNLTAYNETCAAIANIFWNYRMFLLTGNGKYMDVLERTLYNGMISGVSLSGDKFFYPNPLASDGTSVFNEGTCSRSPWFSCSCCPSNVTRFIPSIPGYIYAIKDDQLFVNLFIGNKTNIEIEGKNVSLEQNTEYPWKNSTQILINPTSKVKFNLKIRIPDWAQNRIMDGNLYHFVNDAEASLIIKVNGKEIPVEINHGYATIYRVWKKGDKVDIQFPMNVRLVAANKNVQEDLGKLAVECGPIVYCAEGTDNDLDIFKIAAIKENSKFTLEYKPHLLGGINEITAQVSYLSETTELHLIPYCVWNNRGVGKMSVWFPAE